MSTFKELLAKVTPGEWHVQAGTHIYSDDKSVALVEYRNREANAQYIARCSPATMALVLEALERAANGPYGHDAQQALQALNHPQP